MSSTNRGSKREVFLSDYMGTKDDCEEHFDRWISNLDIQEVIDYAEVWGQKCYTEGIKRGSEVALEAINLNI